MGHEVAALHAAARPRVEALLAERLEVPQGAHSLSKPSRRSHGGAPAQARGGGAVWRIATELHASGKRGVHVADARPVHEALTYLENHGERMGYAEARAQALPIGSGNVEATSKSLVGLRMKRPGSRWKETTGQHVLDLRSLVLSHRWDAAMDLTLAPLQRHVQAAA